MRDAVPGWREAQAVAVREGPQIPVVLHVAVVDLQDVVVHVEHRQRDGDIIHSEQLELHPGHGAGGVLDEHLVDADGDVGTGDDITGHQVGVQNLLREVQRHRASWSLPGPPTVSTTAPTARPVPRSPASTY